MKEATVVTYLKDRQWHVNPLYKSPIARRRIKDDPKQYARKTVL